MGEYPRFFSTCPQSKDGRRETYRAQVARVAEWSQDAGCTGMLIYTDNRLVDPWTVAAAVIERTASLVPLIAVQPVYMHPYTAAKKVASLAFVHGRKVALNLVAGGFRNDLLALHDDTPHDARYERLREYAEVITALTAGGSTTYQGTYYSVKNLRLEPEVPEGLRPELFVSGSSAAGSATAKRVDATVVRYPEPPGVDPGVVADEGLRGGIRVGIIARETDDEAWAVAHERFPGDRRGRLTHEMAMQVSDSQWHHTLSAMEDRRSNAANPYWLYPFENYRTFCPYLVGSFETVTAELSRYRAVGYDTLITDIPTEPADLHAARDALEAVEVPT